MTKQESWEAGGTEVTSQAVTFGKPLDFIKGTYTGSKDVKTDLGPTKLYELKGIVGNYHTVDGKKNPVEPAVAVTAGEFYNVWRGRENGAIDGLFRKSKLGDIIAIQFVEEQPAKTKGYAPFKVFKTMQFGKDPSYAGEDSSGLLAGAEEVPNIE